MNHDTLEKYLIEDAKMKNIPINGSLELLPLCNMNCDMCYVRLSRSEMERQGRLRTAEEWLELGRQMQEAGVLFLLLTGGEPLLYPDFRTLYLELKKLGMILTINTNGTLIDEEWAAFFGEHKPRRINITLYGADERAYRELCHYPGGFEKTVQGIRLLRQHGVDVKISSSLTKANREDIDGLIALGKELDAPVNIDTYMMPATRERNMPFHLQSRLTPEEAAAARIKALKEEKGPEAFGQYARQVPFMIDHMIPEEEKPGHVSCLAGNCSFTINWQGEMRPRVMLSRPAVPVFETGFAAAWKEVIEGTERILLNPKCSACKLRLLCRTCAASALLESGSYDGIPDYMCRYAAETLKLLREEAADRETVHNNVINRETVNGEAVHRGPAPDN